MLQSEVLHFIAEEKEFENVLKEESEFKMYYTQWKKNFEAWKEKNRRK